MTPARPAVPSLLQRLGLASEPPDMRFGWRVVAALLAVYALSFAVFYPQVATNDDETSYINQARLILEGDAVISQIDPFTGRNVGIMPGDYPMGTTLLAAPFVAAFGWRGTFAVSCVCLLAMTLLTGRWIASEGRSPVFALLLLGFPSSLVLGRVAMSDVPSGAVVALGLFLFWHGQNRRPGWWLAAGFVAGASWVFRASNPVLFLPLFVGTVLRREWKLWALVVGGLVGLSVRLISHYLFFGDAFFERSFYRFSPFTLDERLPLYLLGLAVFVPAGLIFSSLYKGRRRPEILVTIATFFLIYLLQRYSTIETSLPKRLILALRYFIPLLPILAFAMSESVPRLWKQWLARRDSGQRIGFEIAAGRLLVVWFAVLVLGCAAVHPIFWTWSSTQAKLHAAIRETVPPDAVLMINNANRKFVDEIGRRYVTLGTNYVPADRTPALLKRHEPVFLVMLDRNDSDWWRNETRRNAEYVQSLVPTTELVADIRPNDTDRLRIWRLTRSR